jgi:predicted nucleic acid-binding protein
VTTPPAAELLLCDTSFVAALALRATHPERLNDWPDDVVTRIDRATLAISVITLAEARFGYLKAGWGQPRIDREERRLSAFLRVPLDFATVDEWARLKSLSVRNGWNVGDNDLWIAATASARGVPLVSCDGDHARVAAAGLEVLHLTVGARD